MTEPPPNPPAFYSYATEKYGLAVEILAKAKHLDSTTMFRAGKLVSFVGKGNLPEDLQADHDWLKHALGSVGDAEDQGTLRPSCEAMDKDTISQVEDRIQHVYACLKNRATRASEK